MNTAKSSSDDSRQRTRDKLLAACNVLSGSQQRDLLDYLLCSAQAGPAVSDRVEEELVGLLEVGPRDAASIAARLRRAAAELKASVERSR